MASATPRRAASVGGDPSRAASLGGDPSRAASLGANPGSMKLPPINRTSRTLAFTDDGSGKAIIKHFHSMEKVQINAQRQSLIMMIKKEEGKGVPMNFVYVGELDLFGQVNDQTAREMYNNYMLGPNHSVSKEKGKGLYNSKLQSLWMMAHCENVDVCLPEAQKVEFTKVSAATLGVSNLLRELRESSAKVGNFASIGKDQNVHEAQKDMINKRVIKKMNDRIGDLITSTNNGFEKEQLYWWIALGIANMMTLPNAGNSMNDQLQQDVVKSLNTKNVLTDNAFEGEMKKGLLAWSYVACSPKYAGCLRILLNKAVSETTKTFDGKKVIFSAQKKSNTAEGLISVYPAGKNDAQPVISSDMKSLALTSGENWSYAIISTRSTGVMRKNGNGVRYNIRKRDGKIEQKRGSTIVEILEQVKGPSNENKTQPTPEPEPAQPNVG